LHFQLVQRHIKPSRVELSTRKIKRPRTQILHGPLNEKSKLWLLRISVNVLGQCVMSITFSKFGRLLQAVTQTKYAQCQHAHAKGLSKICRE